jgi:hypothetical protein
MDRPSLQHALEDRDAVLRAFVAEDGSLRSIPTKIRKRLVVLDWLAQEFEIGQTCAGPRCRDGHYWRAGGTVGP